MAKGKVIQSGSSCLILVEGNIKKRIEPSENIISFPGGSISVTRCADNTYWAHIEVHHGQVLEELHRESKVGIIYKSRLEYDLPERDILPIPNMEKLKHLGVRIRISSQE